MDPRPAPSSQWLRADLAMVLVVFVAGVAAMGSHLHRSAYFDEAWVIEAATQPTVSAGWAMLLHDQSPAPAGYVALLHHLSALVTPSVHMFRITSMVMGIAVLLLALRLARGLGGGLGLVVAAGALLLMPMFQRYGTEVKQYMFEAALTLGMIIAVHAWVAGPVAGRTRGAWWWYVLALIAIPCTFAGWFSIAGTGFVAGVMLIRNRDAAQLKRAMVLGTTLVALAAVMHLHFNRHIAGSATLEGYWIHYYLPLDWSWPARAFESLSTLFANCWYRYDRVPGSVMLVLSMLGLVLWIRREPVTGLAAAGVILVTLAATTLKFWPLNLRVNIHLLVVMHLAVAVGVMVGVDGLWHRCVGAAAGRSIAAWRPWLGLLFAVVLLALVWRESGGADYEVAAVDKLLDRTAAIATPADIVVLLPAARINQDLAPRRIQGTLRRAPWVTTGRIERQLIPLMGLSSQRPVLLAVSHHHGSVVEAFGELNQALLPMGRLSIIWQDRFVALYRFEPE